MLSSLRAAILNEKDVENYYRQVLAKKFGDIFFNSPINCDGYGESKKHNLRLLCEFKDDLDLSQKINQVKVLAQALYYVKRFEINGKILPSVIFVGDRNECFAIHNNDIFEYLGMDFDWSIAPSNAHTNVQLINLMINDPKINPFIFSIEEVADCVEKIKELDKGIKRLIPITPHNITEVYTHFEKKVIAKTNLTTNELANLFVQIIVNPDENYLHPVARRKTIVTKAFGEVSLQSREAFLSFFAHFSNNHTPKQKEQLTAVVDRLIQDITRRKQGEFFTPTIWVDKAHEYIASVFGDDWKEKYVVWDPAWGTGNLTRDYKFKELYVSTLNYSDIQTAEQMGYNPEATKFQFDFLNDDYKFLPEKLKRVIESGRKIIILMNPPYGAVSDFKNVKKNGNHSKNKIEDTAIKKEMNKEKLGLAIKNLYTQFIYRISTFNNINICMFSPPLLFSGIDYKIFRNKILSNYDFKGGFIMDSSQFADVKSWGLTFSILNKK